MTVWPVRSIVRAPAGTFACAAGADADDLAVLDHDRLVLERRARRCRRRRARWSARRDVSGTLTYCRTSGDSELTACAPSATGATSSENEAAGFASSTVSPAFTGSTSNTIRMPVSMCSATWQCSIHLPGFDSSSSTSATKPVGTSTVSFHTRLLVRHAVDRQDEKPLAVDVDRVLHRVQRAAVVDQPQLHDVADAEAPVDVHVLARRSRASRSIQRACLPVTIQSISGIVPLHSTGLR